MPTISGSSDALLRAIDEFWRTYYDAIHRLHQKSEKTMFEPIKNRNYGTTDSRHVAVFERFCRIQLAKSLGVPESEVGPRKIRFRDYRSKSFDVCWPLTGEPRILISVKSMQNAYRNLTNRIEEALGDSAVLRVYNSEAVFGFFFFMLDGNVPRGVAEQGRVRSPGTVRGVAPYLDLIEEGGDFFELTEIEHYRRAYDVATVSPSRNRQDVVRKAEQSLADLLASTPTRDADIHYDGIAFVPTRIRRVDDADEQAVSWEYFLSDVDQQMQYEGFNSKLIEVARLRGFIE